MSTKINPNPVGRNLKTTSIRIGDFIAESIVNGIAPEGTKHGTVTQITITSNGYRTFMLKTGDEITMGDDEKIFCER